MVMVSVLCATYNQAGYIQQAIDSFLMQRTNFEFEILVHDDASTDGTSEILQDYQRKYPDIVKPLYQTVNQYSQGVKITPLNAARAKGRFVALCEGDDYWTDSLKLQTQVDFMNAHPTYSLCVHSSLKVSPSGTPVGAVRSASEDRDFALGTIVGQNPGFFLTSSLLFPAAYVNRLPEFYYTCPVGDWPLILFLSSQGGVRYIDRQMSAYRMSAVNSWSRRHAQDASMQVEVNRGMKQMLLSFDEWTGHVHSSTIRRVIEQYDFRVALLEGRLADAKQPEYARFYNELAWRSRAAITMRQHFPHLASYLASALHAVERLVGPRS